MKETTKEIQFTVPKIFTFLFGDYRVDMEFKDDSYDAWLYREDYGVKDYMFGCPKEYYNTKQKRAITYTPDDFYEMIEANIDDYIRDYREEYE